MTPMWTWTHRERQIYRTVDKEHTFPMRKTFWLALLCLVFPLFAMADEISSVQPATWYVGGTEEFLVINGTGLQGTVSTTIVFSGPAGTYSTEAQPSDFPTPVYVFIPAPVLLTAGHYSVTIQAQDAAGVRVIGPAFIDVIERPIENPPLLSIPEGVNAEAANSEGAFVTFDVSAIGYAPTPPTVECDHQSGAQYPLGATHVTCTASDIFGNTSGTFTITVVDTVAPTLTLPANITSNTPIVTWSVSATDAISGSITPLCSPASGSTFATGTTTVTCRATDDDANLAIGTFTVTVVTPDTPILTLPNDFTVQATGPGGATVTYSVSATLNASIVCTPLSGTLFNFDITTVNCVATTAQGGTSSGSFDVNVVDTTPPALSLPGTINVTAPNGLGAIVTYSATATDLVDGAVTPNCSPASGSLFPVASTTVQCSANDIRGNTSHGSFVVNVTNNPPPTLVVPANITAEATGPNGRVVSFSVTSNAPVVCTPPSGSTFALGTTTVNCSATNAGGTTSRSFTITIVDTTQPVLSIPSNLTVEATGPNGAVLIFSATATDLVDGNVPVVCTPPSGSTFALGLAFVSCSATDHHNNTALGFFDVNVVDTTPPQFLRITASGDANLWPPNHKMVPVTFTVQVVDLVDPHPVTHIVSISSNQPPNSGGDGNTGPDYEITGPLSVNLRAERQGNSERLYTITFVSTDASGNSSTSTYVAHVAQSKGRTVGH
jgi:hypothetical protein